MVRNDTAKKFVWLFGFFFCVFFFWGCFFFNCLVQKKKKENKRNCYFHHLGEVVWMCVCACVRE